MGASASGSADAAAGVAPKEGVLSWDDYFMGVAALTALRSKDPTMRVGACIVDARKRVVGVGYNGFPALTAGVDADLVLPWVKSSPDGGQLETKYPYVCHAELNAVVNKNARSLVGCTIYTTLHPCSECTRVIVQAGIRRVVFASDKHRERPSTRASRRVLRLAGVESVQHAPALPALELNLAAGSLQPVCVQTPRAASLPDGPLEACEAPPPQASAPDKSAARPPHGRASGGRRMRMSVGEHDWLRGQRVQIFGSSVVMFAAAMLMWGQGRNAAKLT